MRYFSFLLLLFGLLMSASSIQAQNCQITGPTYLCANVEAQYQLTHQISHVVGVDWEAPGGDIVTQSFTGASILWLQSGNQTLRAYIHQSNGNVYICQLTVSVLPAPEVAPLPNFSVCPGGTWDVSTPACNGCTYLWSVQGIPGVSVNPPNAANSHLTFSTPGQGEYCVSVTNIIGCVNTSCENATVLPNTIIPVTVNGASPTGTPNDWDVCPNQSVVFSIPVKGMSWEISDGTNTWNLDGQEISFHFPTPGPAVYTVTATGQTLRDGFINSCSATIPQVIHVLSSDPILISCPSVVCEGEAITYTVPAACTGTWEVSPQGTIQGTPNAHSVTVVWHYDAGDPDGYVIYNGTCAGFCSAPSIVEVPIIPHVGTMTGPGIICTSGNRIFGVPNIPGAIYEWSYSPNDPEVQVLSNNVSNQFVLFFSQNFTGPITVHVKVRHPIAGCTYELSKEVAYASLTGNIEGDKKLCIDDISIAQNYSFNSSFPGQLTWTIPAPINFNQTTQAGNHTITIPANTFKSGTNYNLKLTNEAGCSVTTQIVVAPLLDGEILGQEEVCPGVPYTYTISPGPFNGQTFSWAASHNGSVFQTATGPSITIISWPPGTSTLNVERLHNSTGCTASINLNISSVTTPLQITGDAHPCPDSRQLYAATPSFGSGYTWSIRNPDDSPSNLGTIVSGQGSANVEIQWLGVTTPTDLILKLDAIICTPVPQISFPITLTPFQFSLDLSTICEGESAAISTSPILSFASGYSVWVDGHDVYLNNPNLSNIPSTFLEIGTHQVRLQVINPNGCEGLFEASAKVTVLPNPAFRIALNSPLPCPTGTPFSRQLSVISPSSSCSYSWYFGNVQVGIGTVLDIDAPGTYTAVSSCGNCQPRSATIEVAYLCCCEQDVPGNDFSVDLIKCDLSTNCNTIIFGGKIVPWTNAFHPRWVIESPSGLIHIQNISPNSNGFITGQFSTKEVGEYKVSLAADERWLDVNIVVELEGGQQIIFPDFCAFELAGGPATYPVYQVIPTGLYSYCPVSEQKTVTVPFLARIDLTKNCNANGAFTVSAADNSVYFPGVSSTIEWDYLGQTQTGPSITIPAVSSSFDLCMSVTDQNGYNCSICKTVYIPDQISADIDMSNFNVCQGQFTSFIPVITPTFGQSDAIGYHWEFGDGTFSNARTPQKTYNSTGNYHVTLSVETIFGCMRTASIDIFVNPYEVPVGNIVSMPDACHTSTLLSFHQTGGANPTSYEWNPGAETNSNLTVETNGAYSLVLTTDKGCTADFGIDITGLIQAFSSVVVSPDCGETTASFSPSLGFSYQWDFSPVPSSINQTSQAAVRIQGIPGIYHVTVTASHNNLTCVTKEFDMEVYALPEIPVVESTVSCDGNIYSTTLSVVNPPANTLVYWTTPNGASVGNSITVFADGVYSANYSLSPDGCGTSQNVNVSNSINFSSFVSGCYNCDILNEGEVYLYGIPGSFDSWSWVINETQYINGMGNIAPLLLNSSYHEIVLCVTQDGCTLCSDPFCLIGNCVDTCSVPSPTIRRIQCLHQYETSSEYFVHWDFPTDGIVQPCNNTPVTIFNSQNQPVGSFTPLFEFEQIPGFWHFEGVFTLNAPYTAADVHWNIPFCLISSGAVCDTARVFPGNFPVSPCSNPNWPDVLCEGMEIELKTVDCETDPNTTITHLVTLHIEVPAPSTSCNQFAVQITSITGDLLYPISGQLYDLTPVDGIISTDVLLGWASNTANDILCLEVDLREDYDCWPFSIGDGKICYERECFDLTSSNCEDYGPVPTTPYNISAVCDREKSGEGTSVYTVTLTFPGYSSLPNFNLYTSNGSIQGLQVNGNIVTFTYMCQTGNLLFYATAGIGSNTYVIQRLLPDCGFDGKGDHNGRSKPLLVNANSLSVQPNPASTQLRIEYALEQRAQDGVVLSIYDSNGRLIESNEFQSLQGAVLVSVQNWSPGIYSVLLKNNKGKILNSKRLVVSPR